MSYNKILIIQHDSQQRSTSTSTSSRIFAAFLYRCSKYENRYHIMVMVMELFVVLLSVCLFVCSFVCLYASVCLYGLDCVKVTAIPKFPGSFRLTSPGSSDPPFLPRKSGFIDQLATTVFHWL